LSGVTENTLGISNGVYRGSFSIVQESSTPGTLSLTLNEGYGPQELAAIGLTTSARISGDIDEELAVFLVGGEGDISVDSVEAETDFVSALRKRQFEFLINDDDTLSIVDLTTDSVVATRAYAGEQVIHYQGITLSLEFPGEAGDRFVVDGNNAGPNQTFDAHGNNQNILRLARLQSDPVISGGNTLSQAYLQLVGDAGNKATQAEISAQATDVLKQQATEARDRVSGVSLDQEAADLIRFQQAYQASAQVMQVASTIFDAILQVR
jgi:flagellar hook-associated protein FlgK